jgi:GMP synthase-like glutamine amidotransferase
VTHGPSVGPEQFADVALEEGHELVEWDIRTRGAPPREVDAAMVFGGDQNVGEELVHPWLHDEYEALRRWVADGTPLLGVCLGAQTLAYALGAAVSRLPSPQAGFVSTELTAAGTADPVLGSLPQRFEALNANGFAFAVPAGAVELAHAGELAQAFRAGERAWGVQFHPEVRRDQIVRWFAEEDIPPKPLDELVAEIDAGIAEWQELGRTLARAFYRTVA